MALHKYLNERELNLIAMDEREAGVSQWGMKTGRLDETDEDLNLEQAPGFSSRIDDKVEQLT